MTLGTNMNTSVGTAEKFLRSEVSELSIINDCGQVVVTPAFSAPSGIRV